MSGRNPPLIFQIAVDHQGTPVPGAALYHYVTNTSIPKDIFADFELTTPLPQPLIADTEGRYEQYFLEDGQYTFREYDAPLPTGSQLRPPAHHIEGTGNGGDDYVLPVATETVLGGVKDGSGVTIAPDGTISSDYDNIPGPDLALLDPDTLVVQQLTGVSSKLLRIETDFTWAGWAGGSTLGGRGISPGFAWIGEPGSQVHVPVWAANDAYAMIYWTRDYWASTVADSSLSGVIGPGVLNVKPPCMAYVEIAGVWCWVLTSDSSGAWWYAQDIAANYNPDGTLEPAAWVAGTPGARVMADIATSGDVSCMVGNHSRIVRTTDWTTWADVHNTGGPVIGGIATDNDGTWIAVERDTGKVLRSVDAGLTWTVPQIYERTGESGAYAAAATLIPVGAVVYGNGVWLVSGAASYAYSTDGLYWTIETSALGSFYGAGFDGIRFYATNPNNGTDPAIIYQLLVSSIPAHRQVVHEKGAVSAGPDYFKALPNATGLGTDQNGKLYDMELGNASDPAKGAGLSGYKGRTVHDRLQEPGVSVMDHGAVADYVKPTIAAPAPALNTDNRAAFQAAADEAAVLGVPLIVPPGSYYLGGAFTCSTDVIGGGEMCIDHRTINYDSGQNAGAGRSIFPCAMVWSGVGRICEAKFWSPGRHRYDPTLPGAAVASNGGMYCHIFMHGTVDNPCTSNLVTSECQFSGYHWGAVNFGSNVVFPTVSGALFLGNGYGVLYDDTGAGGGLKSRNSYGFRVVGNRFLGKDWTADATTWATTFSAWGGDPIEINAPDLGTTDCVIDNNDIRECYSATSSGGIGIGLAKVRGFSVCGNYLRKIHHDGIHVEDDSYGGVVDDNKIWLAIQGTGSGYLTCEKSYGITITRNRIGGGIAINGGIGFAGPWIPNTSEHILVAGNYLAAALLVINQSNVTVRANEVHRVSAFAPSAGNDGIQITAGPATADSDMQNILVEDNRVTGFYRGISITGDPDCIISDIRVRNNYAPPNPLSTAPVADKSVYVTQATNVELTSNEAIGFNARHLTYAADAPEGVVVGNRGDIITALTGKTYSGVLWVKVSNSGGNTTWLPIGHTGVFISTNNSGGSPAGWARWVRYNGTGGHNFPIASPTESGRILQFSHNGSGAAITITPATGTIGGRASISVPVGYVLTIVDAHNGAWQIQSMHGVSTGWAADTGTAKKTANATYAVGAGLTVGATYVQAEAQAIITRLALVEASLRDATQTIKAMKDVSIAKLDYAA